MRDLIQLKRLPENQTDRRLCFAPNGITSVIFAIDADLEKELKEFKDFISINGWFEYLQIGSVDDIRKIFDFKVNTLYIGLLNTIKIAIYFLDKGFRIDEERSEPYALEILKELYEKPQN